MMSPLIWPLLIVATFNISYDHPLLTPSLICPFPSPSGASGDFQQVTRIARLMVTQLGFCKSLGQVAWSQGGGNTFLGGSMAQPSDFSMQV